ncbi:MAG: BREX-1 system adenine-specific DNA-methyltransferase PglX, partial [Christensenella sp.]|uniref:BREX-1 system adenine-specific DNA-methyltransferase PglX n=1 Tax=Christensenella sp. TaxID=1935934 RepID=UPI002B21A1D5
RSRPQNIKYDLREGFTWTALTVADFNTRYMPKGSIFDAKGSSGFCKETETLLYSIALCNSKPFMQFLSILAPTMDYNAGAIAKVPAIYDEKYYSVIDELVASSISISKSDWDFFENSWDFKTHPLIRSALLSPQKIAAEQEAGFQWGNTMEDAYNRWQHYTEEQFTTLKANEEELNRIFIDIYGLQDELTPEVADKDVTVRKADLGREIRSFISYAVGCMFGRYSLDTTGLAYAGGQWDEGKYRSYIPEDDNILPITDSDYFDDDIVMRFVDFVKIVYGENTLAQNLEFIANALYPNANTTARETIRRYFQSDFFKDHCKIYQKRPIYWLFDSGKQNGFKALVYLHRYDKYTVARVRKGYLHPLQRKYEAEVERMNKLADLPETSPRDKAEFKKQTEKISKQIAECRTYDQIISHMAAQNIELDLDDGVKVNYEKFQGVEVPRGDGRGTVMMDLLGKI